MNPQSRIAHLFKSSLYRKPNPLFIWDEGGDEENVWTAASLYWALVALDDAAAEKKEDSKAFAAGPTSPSDQIVTYDSFPQLLWALALAQPSTPGRSTLVEGGGIVRFENPMSRESIHGLPGLILSRDLLEIHFPPPKRKMT